MTDPSQEQPSHQDLMNKLNEIQTVQIADQPNTFTRFVQKYWWAFMSSGVLVGVFTHKWGVLKYLFSVFA